MVLLGGQPWQRHRRGRHAVLICPGRHVRNVGEPCPYQVVIAEPGHETQEEMAAKAAVDHWDQWHGGMWGDAWRQAAIGQLEGSGEIGKP
jgi:hypothetical protein